MNKRALTLLFVLLNLNFLFGQDNVSTTLKGTLADSKDSEPIIGANVFLDGTSIGTTSDLDGMFLIKNAPVGQYKLVIKMIGYEPITYPVLISNEGVNKNLNFGLKEITYVLDSVNVLTTEDDEWQDYFDIFEEEFLGRSSFSDECKILNPYSIEFNYDEENDILTAYSDSLLKIENRNLGYMLYTSLNSFKIDMAIFPYNSFIKYNILFYELEPKDEDEKEEWEENRFEVFKYGPRRFLFDLVNNKVDENFIMANSLNTSQNFNSSFLYSDNLEIEYSEEYELYAVKVPEELQIMEKATAHRTSSQTNHFEIRSEIQGGLITEEKLLYINKNGYLSNGTEVIYVGDWFKYRLSTFLPDNYIPTQEQLDDL